MRGRATSTLFPYTTLFRSTARSKDRSRAGIRTRVSPAKLGAVAEIGRAHVCSSHRCNSYAVFRLTKTRLSQGPPHELGGDPRDLDVHLHDRKSTGLNAST